MTRFLAFTLLLALLPSKPSDESREAIQAAVERQVSEYPESTLKDIYKSFFQDEFGPGHLVDGGEESLASARAYLEEECREAASEDNLCAEIETVGWKGRFYRVNLSLVNDGKVPFDVFYDAFIESAGAYALPDVKEWSKEWKAILSIIRKMKLDLPSYSSDRKEINAMLSSGKYALHHSRAYVNAYHPHYRLIEKNIFEKRILPYLDDVR